MRIVKNDMAHDHLNLSKFFKFNLSILIPERRCDAMR